MSLWKLYKPPPPPPHSTLSHHCRLEAVNGTCFGWRILFCAVLFCPLLLVSFLKSLRSRCVDSFFFFSFFLRSLGAQGNVGDYCPLGPLNDNTLDSFPFHRHRRIKPQFLVPYFPVPSQSSSLISLCLVSYPSVLFFRSNSPTELKPNFFMEEEFVIVAELRISAHARHTHTHSPLHCTRTHIHKRDA